MSGVFRLPFDFTPIRRAAAAAASAIILSKAAGGGGGNVTLDVSFKAEAANSSIGSTITKSATIAANADRCLIVFIALSNAGYFAQTSLNSLPAAPTWDGVSMTQIGSSIDSWTMKLYAYRLINPNAGTHDLVVSRNNGGGIAIIGISLYNVNQTTPIGTPDSVDGDGNSFTLNANGATGDLALIGIAAWASSSYTITSAAGQTRLESEDMATSDSLSSGWLEGAADHDFAADSKPGAASVTIGYTAAGGWTHAAIAFSVKKV